MSPLNRSSSPHLPTNLRPGSEFANERRAEIVRNSARYSTRSRMLSRKVTIGFKLPG